MLTAIAISYGTLPLDLIRRHGLGRLLHDRGGEKELRFQYRARDPILPAWHEGRFVMARWGCRRGESRVLPCTGWARLATVEAGVWAGWEAEPVEVPASLGFDGGVWYAVRQGLRGVLVSDERGAAHVYPLCEPASHYYRVMTRSEWMPVLIGERI